MRLQLSNNKEQLVEMTKMYFSFLGEGSEADIIINGEKYTGKITGIELYEADDKEGEYELVFNVNEKILIIPLTEETEVHVDRNMGFIETQSHVTVVEIK